MNFFLKPLSGPPFSEGKGGLNLGAPPFSAGEGGLNLGAPLFSAGEGGLNLGAPPFSAGEGGSQYRPHSQRARSRRLLQLLVLALAIPFLTGASNDEARFNALGHKMMCACGCSQILLECNHVGCTRSDGMRNELAAGIQRGDNDDLILSNFVSNYGPAILAAPIRGGFDKVAWITPFAVFILATGLAVWVVRIWKSRPAVVAAASAPTRAPGLDRYRDQVREETEL